MILRKRRPHQHIPGSCPLRYTLRVHFARTNRTLRRDHRRGRGTDGVEDVADGWSCLAGFGDEVFVLEGIAGAEGADEIEVLWVHGRGS